MESAIPDLDALPRRFDRAGPLRSPFRRPDGVVLAEGIATREGILEYPRPDGTTRRELVTRAAVLDTARTLPRSTMTLEHPRSGFVSPDTFQADSVGDVDGESVVEEDAQGAFARVKVALRRADSIAAFDSGIDEVSCGYAVTLDETPGTHPVFGRYDARQVGRVCNHLALVPRGRGGPTVSLRTDSADAAGWYAPPPKEIHMLPTLAALLTSLGVERLDDEGAALTAGLAAAKALRTDADEKPTMAEKLAAAEKTIDALEAKLKAAEDACGSAKADAEKAQGEAAAMAAKLAEMEKADKSRKDAAELTRLQALADKVQVKHDGLDLPALRLAVAKTRVDSVTAESPAAYLDGIIAAVEKDGARSDSRYDSFRAPNDRTDPTGAKPAADPWLANNRPSKEA